MQTSSKVKKIMDLQEYQVTTETNFQALQNFLTIPKLVAVLSHPVAVIQVMQVIVRVTSML